MRTFCKVAFLLWYGVGDEISLFILVLVVAPAWWLVLKSRELAARREGALGGMVHSYRIWEDGRG